MQISLENIQQREEPHQLFLDYFKNNETRRKYNRFLFQFLKLIPTNIYSENGIKSPKSQQIEDMAKRFVELIKKELQTKCKHPKMMRDRDPEGNWYCTSCNQDL